MSFKGSFKFRSDWHDAICNYAATNMINMEEAHNDLEEAIRKLDYVTHVCFKTHCNVRLDFDTRVQSVADRRYAKFVWNVAEIFTEFNSGKPVERKTNG